MGYMWKHGTRRTRPEELVPGTVRVLSARMNYWPRRTPATPPRLWPTRSCGYVSRYALGRDYHKVLRNALQGLADDIVERIGPDGLSRVRRLRAGAREGAGAQRRARLDRQAHQSHRARRRLVLLHRRDPHRPAAARGRTRQRALRHLLGLHSRLPHRRHHRALPARCAALHFVSHHRTARRDSRRAAPHDGQSHLRLRRLPAGVPVEQVRARRRASGFQDAARTRCRRG